MIELGDVAKDSVSGFQGIVVAETNWLHGCRRIVIQPQSLHDGKPIPGESFDEPQCKLVRKAAVDRTPPRTGGPHPEPTRAPKATKP
jgi:hypothetical protein